MDSINDIISNLTPEDIEDLKSMAEGLFGSGAREPEKNEPPEKNGSSFPDPAMLMKLMSIMENLNKEDERTGFIRALKPLLSENRRKRADEALRLLRVMDILPLINSLKENENGK